MTAEREGAAELEQHIEVLRDITMLLAPGATEADLSDDQIRELLAIAYGRQANA